MYISAKSYIVKKKLDVSFICRISFVMLSSSHVKIQDWMNSIPQGI